MKILIITQWYDPEPTFKGQLFARKLVEAGNEVEVITGFPNYPGGKVYDGYKIKPWSVEWIDGVKVCRVALYPSHNSSGLMRMLNYASFAITSFFWGLLVSRNADVIYSYHPPLTTAFCGVVLGKLKRIPCVIDVQDLWPDTLTATGMLHNKKVLKMVDWICQLTYKMASHIVVLSPGFKRVISSRGITEKKFDVIYNWCDEEKLTKFKPCRYSLPKGKFNILFAGNMGPGQGILSIVEAARLLQIESVDVNIVFVGYGIQLEEAKSRVVSYKLSNVHFIPKVPMEEVGELLNNADALLVHLNDDALFSITIPSKTQAYMAMGRPIVCGVNGDTNHIVKEANCGVTCQSSSARSIADAIKVISECDSDSLKEMGTNAANYYHTHMSLNIGISKFIDVFKRVISA